MLRSSTLTRLPRGLALRRLGPRAAILSPSRALCNATDTPAREPSEAMLDPVVDAVPTRPRDILSPDDESKPQPYTKMQRAAIGAGTELGLRAKQIMDRGDLVSDEIILGMIAERMDSPDCANGVIFDGFPRTVAQADGLGAMLEERGLAVDHVIEISVDEAALFARIETRAAETGGSRADDNAETLRKRLSVYHESTAPLLPYYADKGLLMTVDGMNSIDEVGQAIDAILG